VQNFLAAYPAKKERTITVLFDPALFIPSSEPDYRVVEFWGAPDWSTNAEVMVIGSPHTKGAAVPESSPFYAAYLGERDRYEDNVAYPRAGAEKRYRPYLKLPNGGEILVAAGS
jgi:hypothetical protein